MKALQSGWATSNMVLVGRHTRMSFLVAMVDVDQAMDPSVPHAGATRHSRIWTCSRSRPSSSLSQLRSRTAYTRSCDSEVGSRGT